jgi:hypothetical protein
MKRNSMSEEIIKAINQISIPFENLGFFESLSSSCGVRVSQGFW